MKRQHLPFLLLAVGVLSLSGCGEKNSTINKNVETNTIPSNIVLSNNYFAPSTFNLNVSVGGKADITVEAIPDSFAKEAVFKSLNETIATVDANGKVSGVKAGSTQIEVSTKDGSKKELVNVYVTSKITNEQAKPLAATLKENASLRAQDNVLWSHELVQQDMLREGKVYNSTKFLEELAIVNTDQDTYFMVTSQDISVKTESGAPSVDNGTWRFYVDKDKLTWLIHETKSAKRYMILKTQSYIDQPKINILYDVLDMFFVDGRKIVFDMYKDASGLEDIEIMQSNLESSSASLKQSYSSISKTDDVYSSYERTYVDQTVTNQEEFDMEIPSGTKYDAVEQTSFFIDHDKEVGYGYTVNLSFELENKPCNRIFSKSVRFDRHFTCFYPQDFEKEGYSVVTSMYDL